MGLAVAIVAALVAVGYAPTRRLAGGDGVRAMIAGCAIGLMSAAFAGLLLVTIAGDTPDARMKRSFLAMVARLAVVVALGTAAALSAAFAIEPLLFWMAVAYMALLPIEVRLAI